MSERPCPRRRSDGVVAPAPGASPGGSRRRPPAVDSATMSLSAGEILALIAVAVVLSAIVATYMVLSRRNGWM